MTSCPKVERFEEDDSSSLDSSFCTTGSCDMVRTQMTSHSNYSDALVGLENIVKILVERINVLESRIDELEKFKAETEVKFAELETRTVDQNEDTVDLSESVALNQSFTAIQAEEPKSVLPPILNSPNGLCAVKSKLKRSETNPKAVLSDIMKETANLKEEDTKSRVKVIENFVKKKFVPALKGSSPLFGTLFREVHHTGSYYDRLRCGVADEFDLNLCFNIEVLQPILKFVENEDAQGFLKLELTSETLTTEKPAWKDQWSEFLNQLTKPCEDVTNDFRRVIDPSLMRSWFQGVLSKSGLENLEDEVVASVKVIQAGPAFTMKIQTRHHSSIIDVDLVPVFEFKCSVLVSISSNYGILEANSWLNDSFFLIPKPLKKRNVVDGDQMWRLDFHKIESRIIENAGFGRNIIKLLKVMRSGNDAMNGLSSYSLKTIVMLMLKNRRDLEWIEVNSTVLFLEALKSLRDHLKSGKIPYYFNEQCDLLWNMNKSRRADISKWLSTKAIEKMEKSQNEPDCRTVWRKIFGLAST